MKLAIIGLGAVGEPSQGLATGPIVSPSKAHVSLELIAALDSSIADDEILLEAPKPSWTNSRPANAPPKTASSSSEPVSAPPKWKLKNGEQRPASEIRPARTEIPEIADQRPGRVNLTRGNIADSRTAGNYTPETSNHD